MKTLLGCCTKHDKENFEKTPTYETMLEDFRHTSLKDHDIYEGFLMEAVIKTNNTENIGKHYNKVIQMAIEEKYDCVVLMHDDVQMDDYAWTDKLQEAFKEYDVLVLYA
jgi:GT2 family glycosyltransferase